MNIKSLIRTGKQRHGAENWLEPFADELGYSFSGLWRIINGESPITKRLTRAFDRLPPRSTSNPND
jgi:hypothetical protein